MPEMSEAMVLRSVNLPMWMDDHLRGLAYALRCSKSELIRFFVLNGLNEAYRQIGPKLDEATREELLAGMRTMEQHGRLPDTLPFEMGRPLAQDERPVARSRYAAA